jgi:hypothetical protein
MTMKTRDNHEIKIKKGQRAFDDEARICDYADKVET